MSAIALCYLLLLWQLSKLVVFVVLWIVITILDHSVLNEWARRCFVCCLIKSLHDVHIFTYIILDVLKENKHEECTNNPMKDKERKKWNCQRANHEWWKGWHITLKNGNLELYSCVMVTEITLSFNEASAISSNTHWLPADKARESHSKVVKWLKLHCRCIVCCRVRWKLHPFLSKKSVFYLLQIHTIVWFMRCFI